MKPLRWTLLELAGFSIFGIGLTFAVSAYPISSAQHVKEAAVRVKQQARQLEDDLRAKGLDDGIIRELVALHQVSQARGETYTYFMVCTCMIMGLSFVSLAGLLVSFWARLRSAEARLSPILEKYEEKAVSLSAAQAEFILRQSAASQEARRFQVRAIIVLFAVLLANVWFAAWIGDIAEHKPDITLWYLVFFFGAMLATIPLIGVVARRMLKKHRLLCSRCGRALTQIDWPIAMPPEACWRCGAAVFPAPA